MRPRCNRASGGRGGGLQASRRRALAGCGGEGAVRAPSLGRSGDHGRRRTGRPRHREAYGHPAGEPCRWRWGTRTPHSQGGIWSAESLSLRLSPASRPARPLLPGREGGPDAGACPSECVSVISVHSACGPAGRGRAGGRTCLMCAEPPLPLRVLQRQDGGGSLASRWGWM